MLCGHLYHKGVYIESDFRHYLTFPSSVHVFYLRMLLVITSYKGYCMCHAFTRANLLMNESFYNIPMVFNISISISQLIAYFSIFI